MKIKLLLLASILFFAGCEDSETRPDCSLVLCDYFRISINVRYVDQNTNAALLGTNNTTYTLDDLKITRGSDPHYNIEKKLSESDNSVIVINQIVSGDLLKLGSLATDKISLNTKSSETECCSVNITSLKINDVTICAPCSDLDKRVIIIKK